MYLNVVDVVDARTGLSIQLPFKPYLHYVSTFFSNYGSISVTQVCAVWYKFISLSLKVPHPGAAGALLWRQGELPWCENLWRERCQRDLRCVLFC